MNLSSERTKAKRGGGDDDKGGGPEKAVDEFEETDESEGGEREAGLQGATKVFWGQQRYVHKGIFRSRGKGRKEEGREETLESCDACKGQGREAKKETFRIMTRNLCKSSGRLSVESSNQEDWEGREGETHRWGCQSATSRDLDTPPPNPSWPRSRVPAERASGRPSSREHLRPSVQQSRRGSRPRWPCAWQR